MRVRVRGKEKERVRGGDRVSEEECESNAVQ